jgi:hypothetical protein
LFGGFDRLLQETLGQTISPLVYVQALLRTQVFIIPTLYRDIFSLEQQKILDRLMTEMQGLKTGQQGNE